MCTLSRPLCFFILLICSSFLTNCLLTMCQSSSSDHIHHSSPLNLKLFLFMCLLHCHHPPPQSCVFLCPLSVLPSSLLHLGFCITLISPTSRLLYYPHLSYVSSSVLPSSLLRLGFCITLISPTSRLLYYPHLSYVSASVLPSSLLRLGFCITLISPTSRLPQFSSSQFLLS